MVNQTKHGYWIKWLIGIAVFTFVIWKFTNAFQQQTFQEIVWTKTSVIHLVIVFGLMTFNWGIESLKWHTVMQQLTSISFADAFKDVLKGLSTGLVTPNRLGNFIGRIDRLAPSLKAKATLLTLLTNLAQFIITLFIGFLGAVSILKLFVGERTGWVWFLAVLLSLFALIGYFYPWWFLRFKVFKKLPSKWQEAFQYFAAVSLKLRLKVLFLSLIRYTVFLMQYALLLKAFDFSISLQACLSGIAAVYFIMTLIPSPFLGKLFVREAAALVILPYFGVSDPVILISGFLLWCINLALPALVGTILFVKKK